MKQLLIRELFERETVGGEGENVPPAGFAVPHGGGSILSVCRTSSSPRNIQDSTRRGGPRAFRPVPGRTGPRPGSFAMLFRNRPDGGRRENAFGSVEVRPGEAGAGRDGAGRIRHELPPRELHFRAKKRREEDPVPPSAFRHR